MSQRTVLENSAAAADLACQLERREILQRNDLYPESVQVWVESHRHDTSHPHRHAHAHAHGSPIIGRVPPRRVCGYWLSWPRDDHVHDLRGPVMVVHAAIALDMQEVAKLSSGELASIKVGPSLTITVRKCPKCDIVTEKNGGCDHMRCARCSHEYYWSTGKAYH